MHCQILKIVQRMTHRIRNLMKKIKDEEESLIRNVKNHLEAVNKVLSMFISKKDCNIMAWKYMMADGVRIISE